MNTLLNRDFKLPADGWFQIVPVGEHRLRLNRKTDGSLIGTLENRGVVFPPGDRVSVLQVVDAAGVTAMAEAFRREASDPCFAGLLVDEDHFSEDSGKSSAARGWIENVEPRPDGLYGRIRLVDETNVTRGRFRFMSPVFDPQDVTPLGANRVRPTRLDSAALTNKPNMRTMRPLSNRDAENRKESEMDYKAELLSTLGLKADATDEQIGEARTALTNRLSEAEQLKGQRDAAQAAQTQTETEKAALKNRAEQAEAKVADLQRAELERTVEADLVEFAGVIGNRDEAKAQLLANRDGTRKLLGALKAKAETPREPLRNRTDARSPDGAAGAGELPADKARERGRLINKVMKEHNLQSFEAARKLAAQLHAEAFKN